MNIALLDIAYLLLVCIASVWVWEFFLRPSKRPRLINKTEGESVSDGLVVKVEGIEPGVYRGYMTQNRVTIIRDAEMIGIETRTEVAPRTIPVTIHVNDENTARVIIV